MQWLLLCAYETGRYLFFNAAVCDFVGYISVTNHVKPQGLRFLSDEGLTLETSSS